MNSEKKKKTPVAKVDTARLNRTPEQWEACKQEAMVHNSNALEVLKSRQEEIQRQAASVPTPTPKPAVATPTQHEKASPTALETNRSALEELKRRQAEIQRQASIRSPAAAYCNPFALGGWLCPST